jgi:RNA polymerase sigma-70 factor (ECF subfamily)
VSSPPFTGWVTALARAHTLALARVARAEGLAHDDALDAVQEAFRTFLGLPMARSLAGEADDAFALMRVIVRNAARNMRRRHHRSLPHLDAADSPLVDDLPGVDSLLETVEAHVQLLGCVSRLAEMQRRVVELRMLEELGGREAAEVLGLSTGHVAVLLHRAKKALLACMAD